MEAAVLRPHELGPGEEEAWRSMQRADPLLANPFLAPEFTRAVARQRGSARVAVLTQQGRTAGFFPFERRPLGLATPIGSGMCDCQGLVHAAGFEWEAAELLRACGLQAWRYDHLTAGQHAFEDGSTRRSTSPIIDLSGGYLAYLEHITAQHPHFLRDLRRKERRLVREAGELRFVFDDTDPRMLERLMAWKSAWHRAKGQVDLFARPGMRELVADLHRTRSGTCTGVLSVLYADGRPVSCHFGLSSRRILTYWFAAHDPEFAKRSPGLLLHLWTAEAAADRGMAHIDLGKGDEAHKQCLKNGDLPLSEGWVDRGTATAALCRRQSQAAGRLRAAVAGSPALRDAALRGQRAYARLQTAVAGRRGDAVTR